MFSTDIFVIVLLLTVGLVAQFFFTRLDTGFPESKVHGYPINSIWGYVLSRYFWQATIGPYILLAFWIYYESINPQAEMSVLISVICTVYPFSLWAIGKSHERTEDVGTEKRQIRKRFAWQFVIWTFPFAIYFIMIDQLEGFYYLLAGSVIFMAIFLYLHVQLNTIRDMASVKKLEAFCLETIPSFIVGSVVVSALPQARQYIFALLMLLYAYWKFRELRA